MCKSLSSITYGNLIPIDSIPNNFLNLTKMQPKVPFDDVTDAAQNEKPRVMRDIYLSYTTYPSTENMLGNEYFTECNVLLLEEHTH